MSCSHCGAESAEGNFCSHCGERLTPTACQTCGQLPPPGSTYCTHCGELMEGSLPGGFAGLPDKRQKTLVWGLAGTGLAAAILFVAWPIYSPGESGSAERPPSPLATGASSVDLSSMTPREAADRLFNRVMAAVEQDDSEEVVQFLPMAIRAYEMAEPLDLDGKFHLAVLRMEGALTEAGLSAAEEILAVSPNHLLGLGVAADAALALGDTATAQRYYRRWLDVYDGEIERDLPEYLNHERMLPDMESRARAQVN